MDNLIKVGEYNQRFNDILKINISQTNIVRSQGLIRHLVKRNHSDCIKYIERIDDIIKNPDYIGINPNENGTSIELVKILEDNVLLGIKVDASNDFLYVSTMYNLQTSKLYRRIHSGRLKKFADNP